MRITMIASISAMLFTITSCNTSKTIYYTFNDVTITRIDFDGLTNFYYGKCSTKACLDTPCISAEYYGFNNCMDVYVVFRNDDTVELVLYGCGYLQKKGNCKMEITHYRNDKLQGVLDDYEKLGFGLMRLSNVIELEKSFPNNKNSKVVVQYN